MSVLGIAALTQGAAGLIGALKSSHSARPQTSRAASFADALQQAATRFVSERDLDGDGALNASESCMPAFAFNKMDLNGDSKVTQAELIQAGKGMARERMMERLFAKYDSNLDGVLDTQEAGLAEEVFARVDVDGNGVLGREEAAQALASTGRTA